MESLFLPILIIGGILVALYKFNHSLFLKVRKFLPILLGLGLIASGIFLFVVSTHIASWNCSLMCIPCGIPGTNCHPDFAIRHHFTTGGVVLFTAGIIVLVTFYLKKTKKSGEET